MTRAMGHSKWLVTLLLVSMLMACGNGDSSGPAPVSLEGTWRSTQAVKSSQYSAIFRITVAAVTNPDDLSGSWAWGLDYGGGITGGFISGSTIRVEMRDFDTLALVVFQGTVSADVLSGTVTGVGLAGATASFTRS